MEKENEKKYVNGKIIRERIEKDGKNVYYKINVKIWNFIILNI